MNDREKILTRVWAEVLGVEDVGIHDNFFDLGGDSVLALAVIAEAARHGVHLGIADLFEKQTIAGAGGEPPSAEPPSAAAPELPMAAIAPRNRRAPFLDPSI